MRPTEVKVEARGRTDLIKEKVAKLDLIEKSP